MTDDYIISKEDFDQFAHQMTVTFPFMPKIVREEWMARIDRVRSSSRSLALKVERERVLDKLTEKLIDIMIPDGTEFAKFKRHTISTAIDSLRGEP